MWALGVGAPRGGLVAVFSFIHSLLFVCFWFSLYGSGQTQTEITDMCHGAQLYFVFSLTFSLLGTMESKAWGLLNTGSTNKLQRWPASFLVCPAC